MKKIALSIFILSAVAALLSACGGMDLVETDGSSKLETNMRSKHHVSNAELRTAAVEAANKLLASSKVISFQEDYAEERKSNPKLNKLPVVKLAKTRNETDDPDLNTALLMDTLFDTLLESECFDVTMYEGADRREEIGRSRDNIDDPNFDEDTVIPEGTIKAARLILNSKVVSNKVKQGRTELINRFFVVDLIDIKTGLTLCKFNIELAFAETKAVLGY